MFIIDRIYFAMTMLQDRREDKGAAMVEYALLVAGMAVVVVAAVAFLGSKITDLIAGIDI